jgi:hypothetical protein
MFQQMTSPISTTRKMSEMADAEERLSSVNRTGHQWKWEQAKTRECAKNLGVPYP